MLFWLLLGIIGTFFEEINNSITKHKTQTHHFLKLGVISSFFWMSIFFLSWLYKYYFTDITLHFHLESIPLLWVRLIFEILQSYFTILAIQKCDRTTFSVIRIITIPLLVIVDIFLWYQFTQFSLIGMWIIFISFLIFNIQGTTINFKWWYFVLFTAVNAVLTISLFKYSLSHYGNSVEVDQGIIGTWILFFFIGYNYYKNKCCALKLIQKEKQFLLQWLVIWLSSLILSYSYVYLNASEATMIKRAGEMFWSIFAGCLFFHEKNLVKKLLLALCIVIWLIVMML